MGMVEIRDSVTQQAVAATFLARLCCHMENGPCDICVDYCAAALSDRAYAALRDAFEQAAKYGSPGAGWGMLMVAAACMAPNPNQETAVLAPTPEAAQQALNRN